MMSNVCEQATRTLRTQTFVPAQQFNAKDLKSASKWSKHKESPLLTLVTNVQTCDVIMI